uniref:Uncharacterized protein n=1 Tax=Chrysotila carterae TaxID=13221 RepID=A0A7S4C0M4_CHRCT|mmetsp:Transcript_48345/g.104728  ORF Transcript_48345/g.104728 Transcript_48345/m.104728 type:complete len:382 (+) Transcript_48345:241-1386(+)
MAKAQILTAQLRLLLLFYAVTTAVARDSLPMLSSRHTLTSRNGRSGVDGFSDPLLEPLERWQPSLPSMRLGSGRGGSLTSRAELLAARRNADKGSTSLAYKRAIWATIWSFVATAVFGVAVILPLKGGGGCMNFFTAFLVEKSLSVDNLFVFLMLFEYFRVPERYTQRVLKWGILSALVLRGFMIAAGVAVVRRFRPVLLVFALVLVVSAIKMLAPEDETDLVDNPVMKFARRFVKATDKYDGEKFFTIEKGERRATPLFVVLIMIEISDVIFAVDSIPAVVGISQDPLIVYSSNIFALMALRSLYLLLSKSVETLYYLKHAVALILLFVGLKMTAEFFHFEVSSFASLSVIVLLLTGGTAASLLKKKRDSLESEGAKSAV